MWPNVLEDLQKTRNVPKERPINSLGNNKKILPTDSVHSALYLTYDYSLT